LLDTRHGRTDVAPIDEVVPAIVTVTLDGEYDIARSQELRDAFLVPMHGAVCVVADMTAVTFIDSTALRTLIQAQLVLAERGVSVQLTHVRPAVLRVFQVTGTAMMFGLS
jgi:anti-anti-sigma factor